MQLRSVLASLLLVSAACFAEDYADTSKLAGSWDLDGAGKTTWKLAATSDGVHFTYTRGGQKVADFDCNTSGKECAVSMEGKKAKVSVYFNGPLLVMLETRGDNVVKWRFGAVAGGQELEVETTPITGSGKPETQRFKRVDVQASNR
jgi:hypothetical protein